MVCPLFTNGSVTGNNLVWRKFTFTPVTTDRIRIYITKTSDSYSRITEVEAWTATGGGQTTTTTAQASSQNPSTAGSSVTFTATVSGSSIAGCTAVALAGGSAQCASSALAAGSHSIVAGYSGDAANTASTSPALAQTVTALTGSVNVALPVNGGVATASSTYSSAYPPSGAIDGDRRGQGYGSGGTWSDATANVFPDWLQIQFDGSKTLIEIDVFSLQSSGTADPTPTMTFTSRGLTSFQVQTWNGSAWTDVPGGNVTGNNLVWRKFSFDPITADRIRVLVNGSASAWSEIAEVEAWTQGTNPGNGPPSVALTSPSSGSTKVAPATIDLAATATDPDGIAKVEFYRGTTLIGTVTNSPYVATDAGLAVGTYTYTAKAYDNLGATTTSSPASITVKPASYTLLVTTSGSGAVTSNPAGINCGSTCLANFANGASVVLTATANPGYSFAGWSGDCSGKSTTCTVAMSAAKSVSAAFQLPTTTFQYDPNGNLTQTTDPLGRIRQASYDALDRPYLVKEPHPTTIGSTQGQITTAYDGQDQTTAITDPRTLQTSYTVDGLGNLTALASPDTGTTNATYDEAGNLKSRTDARGITVSYQYDALNRLTKILYGDQTVILTWDSCANGIGRLCSLADNSGSTTYAYDSHGRVLSKTETIGTIPLKVSYGYDAYGRLATLTLPSGKIVAYGWSNGQVSSVSVNGTAQLSGITYQPFGPVAGWTWGNGRSVVRQFDLAGRLKAFSFGSNAAGTADSRGLALDAAGRIMGLVDGLDTSFNQTYGYDQLDRLTSDVLNTVSPASFGYAYDLSGNRTSKTVNGTVTTYTTPAGSNRLASLAGGQARTYTYNAIGEITGDGTGTYTYDNAGRRVSAKVGSTTTTYAYNALGQRVKKAGGATTLYLYDEQGQLLGEYNASGTAIQETVWLGDLPVLTVRGTAVYYVHTDHLNTPRRVTRPSDNKLVWSWESEAFGNSFANENPAGLGAFTFNLRFPGQVFDAETGLSYNYFRDYDPGTGRYVESDPIGLNGGINTYTYVGGNPISRTDPSGLLFGGLIDAGECDGDAAAEYWANKSIHSSGLESLGYDAMGLLASLWTPQTSDSTALALLSAVAAPGAASWAEWSANPTMYELGAKTVPTAVWNNLGLGGMSVTGRGAAIWGEYGWRSLGISGGPWLNTLLQGPTPGGWLGMVGLLDYAKNKFGNRGTDCGCRK